MEGSQATPEYLERELRIEDPEELSSLIISGAVGNLEVQTYQDKDIIINVAGYSRYVSKATLLHRQSGDRREKDLTFSQVHFFPFFFRYDMPRISILLPENYTGSLLIEAVCKNLNIAGNGLSGIKITGTTADVNIQDFKGDFILEGVSGKLNLAYSSVEDKKIDISGISGVINIRIPKDSSMNIKTDGVTGSIANNSVGTSKIGSLIISGVTGAIVIDNVE
jgi:hypothetical protein